MKRTMSSLVAWRAHASKHRRRGRRAWSVGARLLLLLALALLVLACGEAKTASIPGGATAASVSVPGGAFRSVGPEGFAKLIESKGDVPLINVHVPYEGEIAGTTAFLPFDQIAGLTSQLPADRTAPLFLYCRSGRMSTEAAATLVQLGYSNVVELDGGMNAWETSGRSIAHATR